MLYDITRFVSPSLAVWTGDTTYSVQQMLSLDAGSSVNLTTLNMTAHLGTHADAYYHYTKGGAFIGEMPLTAYIGKARVVTVNKRDGALTEEDFAHIDLNNAERLLIHSNVSHLPPNEFPTEFPYLTAELVRWFANFGIRLIGLDSPSVDAFDSTTLPSHHAIREHGMVNLEGLYLRDVPDGDYELIALPLKLDLACGSPVRAVLRTL
jgi:arylformamidase